MNLHAVEHRIDSEYSAVLSDGSCLIRLRTASDDTLRVMLHYRDQFKHVTDRPNAYRLEMLPVAHDGLFVYYQATIPDMARAPLVCYFFELSSPEYDRESRRDGIRSDADGSGGPTIRERGDSPPRWYYGNYRFTSDVPTEDYHMFYVYPQNTADACRVPDWASHGVVYQVFPDRFDRDADAVNESRARPFRAWDEEASDHEFLGGTLTGIRRRLDHITSLGTTVLYLTPIFRSDTSHRYNTFDYFQIDPMLGTQDDLTALVADCHARDIRVVLDAVFNHCGTEFFAFQDLLTNGAQSAYADWFRVHAFPVEVKRYPAYDAFGYLGYMPKLNTAHPDVIAYFCDVATYWIRECDIDGWRLDCAPEVDHELWRRIRRAVKHEKADAVLIGEFWHDARTWLAGDQIDGALNYESMLAAQDWLVCGTAGAPDVINRLERQRMMYRPQTHGVFWNQLDSHDTDRWLTQCKGDRTVTKLALALQMTLPGVPVVYYGDEVGMEGAEPHHRGGMRWNPAEQDTDLLALYREIGPIVRDYTEFSGSEITFDRNAATEGVLLYRRGDASSAVFVAINPTERRVIVTPSAFRSVLPSSHPDETRKMSVSVGPKSAQILHIDHEQIETENEPRLRVLWGTGVG